MHLSISAGSWLQKMPVPALLQQTAASNSCMEVVTKLNREGVSENESSGSGSQKRRRLDRSRSKWTEHRRRLLVAGLLALLLIVGVGAYSVYQKYVQPPRVLAASINGDVILTMGEVVKRVRVLPTINSSVGRQSTTYPSPLDVVLTTVQDYLIRRGAHQFGIVVTPLEVEEEIQRLFYPRPKDGEHSSVDQLQREYRENYGNFLAHARLSDTEYREFTMAYLYRDRMHNNLARRVPAAHEQVELMWIRLPLDFPALGSVLAELQQGASFEETAKRLNRDTLYADKPDRPGYVGWVPRGAFPDMDPLLFGNQGEGSAQRLRPGEIGGPVVIGVGVFIVKLLAGPDVHTLHNEKMRQRLSEQALQRWLDKEWSLHNIKINFDSEWYAWVMSQVRRSLPVAGNQ